MRWPLVWRGRAERMETYLRDAVGQADKEAERCARQTKEWRRAALDRRRQIESLTAQLTEARERAASAESAYRGLISKMLTPPKAPQPLPAVDPEMATLDRISDETVTRMAEQFVRDGLGPEAAEAHARQLVTLAERAFGAPE